jgi:hypothetical protein
MLTESEAQDKVGEGIENFGLATQDRDLIGLSVHVYQRLAEVFRTHLLPAEPCSMAFVSMIIRPDLRTECFLAMQPSRIVIAWKEGVFRKRLQSLVIDPMLVTDVSYGPGTGVARNAYLLKIREKAETVVTLPVDQARLGGQIKHLILNTTRRQSEERPEQD